MDRAELQQGQSAMRSAVERARSRFSGGVSDGDIHNLTSTISKHMEENGIIDPIGSAFLAKAIESKTGKALTRYGFNLAKRGVRQSVRGLKRIGSAVRDLAPEEAENMARDLASSGQNIFSSVRNSIGRMVRGEVDMPSLGEIGDRLNLSRVARNPLDLSVERPAFQDFAEDAGRSARLGGVGEYSEVIRSGDRMGESSVLRRNAPIEDIETPAQASDRRLAQMRDALDEVPEESSRELPEVAGDVEGDAGGIVGDITEGLEDATKALGAVDVGDAVGDLVPGLDVATIGGDILTGALGLATLGSGWLLNKLTPAKEQVQQVAQAPQQILSYASQFGTQD